MATIIFDKSSLTSGNGYLLGKIEYSYSQSILNNTSTITCKVYVKKDSDSIKLTEVTNGTFKYSLTVDDKSFIGDAQLSILTTYKLIGEFSHTINHEDSGKKTFDISGCVTLSSNSSSAYYGKQSIVDKSVTLPTIPRASSITSAGAVTLSEDGTKCNVKWTPLASSFVYKLKFQCGSVSYTTTDYIAPKTTSAFTYDKYLMTIAKWAAAMPKAYSATCTVTLYTYQSSTSDTAIGSSSKTFTLTLPSSVKPKISFTTDSGVSTWLAGDGNKYYLQGISKYKLAATFTRGTGSYISSCSISGTGLSLSGTGSSTTTTKSLSGTTSALSKTGSQTYTAKVTDGRTSVTSTKTITVYAYAKPTLSLSAARTSTSGSVKITYKASCSSVNSQNALTTLKIYQKLSTATTWPPSATKTITLDGTSASSNVTLTGFDSTLSYDFKAVVGDKVGNSSVEVKASVASAFRLLNINKNKKGLALGKMSEDNTFDCALPMKITKANVNLNTDASNAFMITRTGLTGDSDNSRGETYIASTGAYGLLQGRRDVDGEITYNTNLYLLDGKVYTDYLLQAKRGHFTATTDAAGDAQNNVALRVGSTDGTHLDIDGNEIQAKNGSTSPDTLYLNNDGGAVYANGWKFPEIQRGAVKITPTAANTSTPYEISFDKTFSGTPTVIATPVTSVPGTIVLGVGVTDVSTTGATIHVTRSNTSDTWVYWIAIY